MRALSTVLFLIDLIHRRKTAFEDNLALGLSGVSRVFADACWFPRL